MLPVLLAFAAAAPAIGVGWWLRSSEQADGRYYGRLNVRVCALLIAAGMFVFGFVYALALGASLRAAAGMGLWVACVMTSFSVFPMVVSGLISRKTRRDYLPW
ncbi:MAG: hypothetical protein HY874_11195 [Chloroflexi bacterium]|nr:hypothetical protein [Chloroflexota bacterium]